MKNQVWIGMVQVKPLSNSDVLEDAVGAFVPTLALAVDANDFTGKVTRFLNTLELEVLQIEDIETFEERRQVRKVSPEVIELEKQLTEDRPVALSSFYTYENEDDLPARRG